MHYIKPTKEKVREEKRWAIFRLGVVLLLSAIILVAYLMGYCSMSPDQELLMEPKIPSLKEYYPQALAEAIKWRQDAYMVDASINIRPSRILGSFAFDSESDPEVGFLFHIEGSDEGFQVEPKELDAPGRWVIQPAIEPDEWALDSLDVARIAYENGGREFLKEHPEVNTVLLHLMRVSGSASDRTGLNQGNVIWVATFYRLRKVSIDIYIDPITGEVLATDFQEGSPDLELLEW